jgi:hypothetical protein
MKIKITEEQYRLFKSIKESTVNIDPYLSELKKISEIANKYYNKLTFISVAELINNEVSFNELRDLKNKSYELWSKTTKIMNTAENEIDRLGDTEEAYVLVNKIDDYQQYVKKKLDVVSDITDFLINIHDASMEAEWPKYFDDIKTTEL